MNNLKGNILAIEHMIYIIRGNKVMLDTDLAKLYGVETKILNQAIKRNIDRFPEDFMFQITQEEFRSLNTSQTHGGHRYLPFAFTENGVAMLSSVLNSKQAIKVNISIMRIFTKIRKFYEPETNLFDEVKTLKSASNELFKVIFERIDLIEDELAPRLPPNRKKIGIKTDS